MSHPVGARLVLLSGWGIDKRIWQTLDSYWPSSIEHHAVDWPGYGEHPTLAENATIDQLASAMASHLPADAVWVGWSLGGLLAGALLDKLPAPRRLILLGIGDRFCTDGGVSETELLRFRRAFNRNPTAAWQHFLRWQVQGEPCVRNAHRQLQTLLDDHPNADHRTLSHGLDWLAHTDNTQRFENAPCPIIRVVGKHDPFVGPSTRDRAMLIANAGHCPMLSQPAQLALMLAEQASLTAKELA
ncbi:alpha/beta fold hydrolase [Vreelandella olivaria]|uniref:alpha/beta fold hydrolase n=1 Tax=Vreelandella olivaria TaxID=390919 RepID=UPI00201FAFFE|nr:alpha/beta fold hydrolase [Halomonas olivaria]